LIKKQLKSVFLGSNISTFELPDLFKGECYVMDAFPLKEKDGSIIHAGVIIRNITHLKMAEKELKVSLEKEKELSEMKSRFITMASHEFRTPLSAMLLSVQLLKKYQTNEAQEKVDKHLGRIETSIQLLDDILKDFLTVGKIQEGKYVHAPVAFNIKEHISGIIKEFGNTGKEGQHITYKHRGDEIVFLDPVLTQHIITNLISNAIKFSTKKVLVEVATQWLHGRPVLSVKDHGIGIPAEYREHLFAQFYRASNATNIQGTGLGLYTVSKYVELMEGTIRYTSKLDKGTSFVITF
jgi:signal transduction histidine kinase